MKIEESADKINGDRLIKFKTNDGEIVCLYASRCLSCRIYQPDCGGYGLEIDYSLDYKVDVKEYSFDDLKEAENILDKIVGLQEIRRSRYV